MRQSSLCQDNSFKPQVENSLQRKFSSQSSSKQTTYQSFAGLEDGVESDWRPEQVYQSPFTTSGLQDKPIERPDSGQYAITPPDSCTDDDLRHWHLPKHGSSKLTGPERTKSKLLSTIADEMSRTHNQKPRHVRKNSADSQDSIKRAARKRRAWHLTKAFSAPGEDMFQALESNSWGTPSPCESGDWAQHDYQRNEMLGNQASGGSRPEFGALRGRTVTRKRYTGRYRTSRFIGVGSSNRKTQWQARILVQGKVTHLGYYSTEEDAACIYDRVALSLNPGAQTNFPASHYSKGQVGFSGLGREDLQRALGVKPMDKSSRFRGVSRKKGKWEAKVMVNRKWAYRALFDSEDEAAHAYDAAVWRLKPREATSFINFKDGVSVRSPPSGQPENLQTSQSMLNMPEIKMEEQNGPLGAEAVTLSEMHIPSGEQGDYPSVGPPSEPFSSPSQPHRSQSAQLPLLRTESARTGVCVIPPISTLASTPSLPELGLVSQGSHLTTPGPVQLSPQPSGVEQKGSPARPAISVPGLPHLPDPNSIGVPPPENLPFPELVAGTGMPSPGMASLHGVCSTPTRSFTQPDPFLAQPPPLSPAPSRAASSGIPPLHNRGSMSSECPSSYLHSNMAAINAASPRPGFPEQRPANVMLHNPFLQAASHPAKASTDDLVGLSKISPIERQASAINSLELPPLLQRAATEGLLPESGMSTLSADLPFAASGQDLGMHVDVGPRLSHIHSLASINTAQYVPQAQYPNATCGTPTLGSLYTAQSLSQVPSTGLPPIDNTLSYDTVRDFANSRCASSNLLHSAQTAGLLAAAETNVPTVSRTCDSLSMLNASELVAMGHDLVPLPTHTLHHAVTMDASFLGRPEMLEAQLMQPIMPGVPDNNPLSVQQADLLRNLDVDVELNDPVPLAPVQIGGEDMNVYSAHIMGQME